MIASLRGQLLLWLLPALLALLGVNTVLALNSASSSINAAYDRSLLGSARAIADNLRQDDEGIQADIPYAALEMFEGTTQERVYYRVLLDNGTPVTGYEDLPAPPPDDARDTVFYDGVFRGETIRLVAQRKPLYAAEGVHHAIVIVAETTGTRTGQIRQHLAQSLAREVALISVAALLAWIGVRRSLAPVEVLSRQVAHRPPQDLAPISTDTVHEEIRPLISAINGHTERVGRMLKAQEQFVADASHQIRTPLAVLRTQAELLLRTADPAERDAIARRVADTTRQTGHLTQQLLTLARSQHEPPQEMARVELNRLCADVLMELVPLAREKEIDLGYEPPDAPVDVPGEPALLRELVSNLVENALRYTPPRGVVTLFLQGGEGRATLSVVDSGPGIPEAERSRVFERFYRGRDAGETLGSGLGLAIVREIAQRHGATVSLDTPSAGRGLQATVSFPRR